jgi:tubulin polyglutamylase TTLL9
MSFRPQKDQRPPQTIRFKTHLRNTILDVLRSRGWKETDSEMDWEFNWAEVFWIRESLDSVRLSEFQKVNHFRNHYELTRKDLTIKNVRRYKRMLEKADRREEAESYDFIPATYSLPADYGLFEVEFKKNPNSIWIMKPPAKAQGKGIFLFTKIADIADWKKDYSRNAGTVRSNVGIYSKKADASAAAGGGGGGVGDDGKPQSGVAAPGCSKDEARAAATAGTTVGGDIEPYLAQRYIDRPHLIGGKKYDMRIYILVTSWSPLSAWLYRGAFCRFCHHRFDLGDIDNTFIHVTNVAVQKTNPKYSVDAGCKWGLRMLKQYIAASSGEAAANRAMADIQGIMLKTLLAVQNVMMQDKHCFELYGYDVMLDADLKPWLIEVNASPSLTAETPSDYHLKFNLLEDMLNIVDVERKRRGDELRIGGFDLIWDKNQPAGIVRETLNAPPGSNELAIPISQMRFPPRMTKDSASNSSQDMRPLM